MPVRHVIDEGRRLVLSRGWDEICAGELTEAARVVARDPAFYPGLDQLCDLSQITSVAATSEEIRWLAENSPFGAGSRRAVVAPGNLVYGLSRMYVAYSQGRESEIRIFRDLDAAERWLGARTSPPQPHSSTG
jgi:hypothetical protein